MNSDSISIAVIGKTGVGKSYFSNLIQNNQKPKQGIFKVYDSLESGTQQPQIEMGKTIQYGNDVNDQVTLNIIDTPSFFDTSDYANQQKIPQSITHLKNIFQILQNIQLHLNKVILIFSCGQRFDVHHKGVIDMSTTLFAKHPNLCVVLTKCQNLYDPDVDDEEEIMNKLQNCQNQWQSQLALYGIEEIYYLSGQPISRYQNKKDSLSQFYYKQWTSLYNSIKQSKSFFINSWEQQPMESKKLVQQYFNYQIPFSEDVVVQQQIQNNQRPIQQNESEQQNLRENPVVNNEQEIEQQSQSSCLSLDVLINGINSNIRVMNNNLLMTKKIKIQGLSVPDTSLGLIHYSNQQKCRFIQLKYKYQKEQVNIEGKVEITDDHLIYCSSQSKFLRAQSLSINDTLLYKHSNLEKQNVKIIEITSVIKQGYYSPLTSSGMFFGNGILLSCYVSPNQFSISQETAHIALKPLILYRELIMKLDFDELGIKTESNNNANYQAPYSKVLELIFCCGKKKNI